MLTLVMMSSERVFTHGATAAARIAQDISFMVFGPAPRCGMEAKRSRPLAAWP